MMKIIILITTIFFTSLFGQQRSMIFNTGNPAYTCSESGGSYTDYSCSDECAEDEICTILMDGYTLTQSNTLADKFTVNENYALEAFGVYLTMGAESGNPALDHTATIQIHADSNDTPGEVLGEWNINVSTGYYHSLYVGDGCIDLDIGNSYWISVHVDNSYTELIWLYTQAPFYTFSQTEDNGLTWDDSEYGVAGAAAIWAEQIYYTDWQPAESADVNLDGTTNVLDVVQLVQFVLGNVEFEDEQIQNGDFNQDEVVNVLDVVSIVNLILFGNISDPMPSFLLEDINPASDYYEELIGTETFAGNISVYYFGKGG